MTELLETGRFGQGTVRLYDRTVPESRLTAGWSTETASADVRPLFVSLHKAT